MLSKSTIIHLRSLRRKAGLSQKELAYLLSIESYLISKYELRKRKLPTHILIACCIIFDCSPKDFYPDLTTEVAQVIKQNAQCLRQQSTTRYSANTAKRDESLNQIIERIP